MVDELKKDEQNEQQLTETEMDNVAGGNPFPNESLVTDEMKVKTALQKLTPLEQLEVLQLPDVASQKAKIMEILARRDA